jgi:predicted enzyme related to lactoylglutathione lyase
MTENAVRWFEIYVQDMARARGFYEAVLGVTLERLGPVDQDLEMWAFQMSPDRPGAGGALVRTPGMPSIPGGTLVYFGCEDCAVQGGRVVAAGGRIQREKMSIGEYGHIVLAIDTEGNLFGLHSMA